MIGFFPFPPDSLLKRCAKVQQNSRFSNIFWLPGWALKKSLIPSKTATVSRPNFVSFFFVKFSTKIQQQ